MFHADRIPDKTWSPAQGDQERKDEAHELNGREMMRQALGLLHTAQTELCHKREVFKRLRDSGLIEPR